MFGSETFGLAMGTFQLTAQTVILGIIYSPYSHFCYNAVFVFL